MKTSPLEHEYRGVDIVWMEFLMQSMGQQLSQPLEDSVDESKDSENMAQVLGMRLVEHLLSLEHDLAANSSTQDQDVEKWIA